MQSDNVSSQPLPVLNFKTDMIQRTMGIDLRDYADSKDWKHIMDKTRLPQIQMAWTKYMDSMFHFIVPSECGHFAFRMLSDTHDINKSDYAVAVYTPDLPDDSEKLRNICKCENKPYWDFFAISECWDDNRGYDETAIDKQVHTIPFYNFDRDAIAKYEGDFADEDDEYNEEGFNKELQDDLDHQEAQ